MSDKPNYVELPLDPEYVTQDGAYMAGYIWGQYVRSEPTARQMFTADTPLHEDFFKGVADGYNDKLNEMNAQIKAPKQNEQSRSVEQSEADARITMDQLAKLFNSGTMSARQFNEAVDLLYRTEKDQQAELMRQLEKMTYDKWPDEDLPF
jgi:hypothetical protein